MHTPCYDIRQLTTKRTLWYDANVWLGCARKYIAMLSGPPVQPRAVIASLGYFIALLEEVAQVPASDAYWEHVRREMQLLERRWVQSSSPGTREP